MDETGKTPGNPQNTLDGRLAILKSIHGSLLLGVSSFTLVVLWVTKARWSKTLDLENPLMFVALVVAMSGVAVASVVPKFMFRPGAGPQDLVERLNKYQMLMLMRAALVEGGALFGAVVLMMTANLWALVPVVIGIAALLFYRPSQDEFEALIGKGTGPSAPPTSPLRK